MSEASSKELTCLDIELKWLKAVIEARISACQSNQIEPGAEMPPAPLLPNDSSCYGSFVAKHRLNDRERFALILAITPHLRPNLLNVLVKQQVVHECSKVCKSQNGVSIIPTVETFLFLVAGEDIQKRAEAYPIFETDHLFYKESVLDIGEVPKGESPYNGILNITTSFRDLFILNKYRKPRFNSGFPAHLLDTNLEWEDLFLMPATQTRLEEVKAYLQFQSKMVNELGMEKHARPGCRILFYGDSGTGKTLAATLMGKHLGRDVYRVDISAVTSKYVGETTKRLDSLFNAAENKGWIIFIDEGDALLGQRKATEGNGNNSHYANQDVAYLLQRIESYDGIIIIATNFKNNIDQAFTRRFQGMVRFQLPDEAGQLKLWNENVSKQLPLAASIDLPALIKRHPLSPAAIINVIFRATVITLQKGRAEIGFEDLSMCINDEVMKYLGRQQMGM